MPTLIVCLILATKICEYRTYFKIENKCFTSSQLYSLSVAGTTTRKGSFCDAFLCSEFDGFIFEGTQKRRNFFPVI